MAKPNRDMIEDHRRFQLLIMGYAGKPDRQNDPSIGVITAPQRNLRAKRARCLTHSFWFYLQRYALGEHYPNEAVGEYMSMAVGKSTYVKDRLECRFNWIFLGRRVLAVHDN